MTIAFIADLTVAGASGGANSVWSATDAAANGMTLTNGGLTFAGGAVNNSIRGSVSKTSGKLYVEFLVVATGNNVGFGLASAGFNASSFLGSSNYSGGVLYNNTVASAGFTDHYTTALYPVAAGEVWALAVDFSTGNVWFAKNNVWVNSSNPATGSLPIMSFVPATVGALFPGMTVVDTTEQWTLQATPANQKYAPPAGFQSWDTPSTSTWSGPDAAASAMTLTNGGLTVTPTSASWRTVRSSIGKTTGKLYVEFSASGGTIAGANIPIIFGLANAGFNIADYLGNNPYSGGLFPSYGATFVSSAFTGNYNVPPSSIAVNDVWAISVDFTAGSIWLARNNVWINGSNPVTGSLPVVSFTPATVGALFAAMSLQSGTTGVWTLQPTAAAQTYAPPSGFAAWDASGGATQDLAGNLAPSLALAAGLTFSVDLAGGITPSVTFAADITDIHDLAGDLTVSVSLAADVAGQFSIVGDLAPAVAFVADIDVVLAVHNYVDLAGNLGGASLYGKFAWGTGSYSRNGAITPIFAGDISGGGVSLVGDLAPSVAFAADLGLLVGLAGDIAPQIALGGLLTGDAQTFGDLPFQIDFAASTLVSGPLWGASAPCPTPPWAPTDPCPPTLWTPVDPCDVEWEESELCNG